jgi:glycine cleavage system H protein
MSETRYTDQHEWVRVEGDEATVGITKYAAEQLGDVVFVEVPETGRNLAQGGDAAVVESVKAASEVYAPISGEVTSANDDLANDPAKVNADPEGEGWFFKLKMADKSQLEKLMTAAQYSEFVKGLYQNSSSPALCGRSNFLLK